MDGTTLHMTTCRHPTQQSKTLATISQGPSMPCRKGLLYDTGQDPARGNHLGPLALLLHVVHLAPSHHASLPMDVRHRIAHPSEHISIVPKRPLVIIFICISILRQYGTNSVPLYIYRHCIPAASYMSTWPFLHSTLSNTASSSPRALEVWVLLNSCVAQGSEATPSDAS